MIRPREERKDRMLHCPRCNTWRGGAAAIAAHGMCEECLEPQLRRTRETWRCFRDQEPMEALRDGRHMFCPKCGLVVAIHERDIVRASIVDDTWHSDPEGEHIPAVRMRGTLVGSRP